MEEEGDTCPASQISRINPGDQWGDRCCNQMALEHEVVLMTSHKTDWGAILTCPRPREHENPTDTVPSGMRTGVNQHLGLAGVTEPPVTAAQTWTA